MSYLYTDLKSELNDALHQKLGSISNLRAVINRSVREVNSKNDLRGTKARLEVPQGFFNSVYEIPAPGDIKGDSIIDISPIRDRSSQLSWRKTNQEEFDRLKDSSGEDLFAMSQESQYKKILINNSFDSKKTVLNECDSITANGTWAASGDISGLANETYDYLSGSGSLRFLVTYSSGSGLLTNSTMASVDLTDYLNKSTLFFSVKVPSHQDGIEGFNRFKIRFGSSAANYYELEATAQFSGDRLRGGWNLVSAAWTSQLATIVGSPNVAAITYARVELQVTSSVATDIWYLDQLSFITGSFCNVSYYSKDYWVDTSGAPLQNSEVDSDYISADDDEKEMYLYCAAKNCAQILRESNVDLPEFKDEYRDAVTIYRRIYKSERRPGSESYYQLRQI